MWKKAEKANMEEWQSDTLPRQAFSPSHHLNTTIPQKDSKTHGSMVSVQWTIISWKKNSTRKSLRLQSKQNYTCTFDSDYHFGDKYLQIILLFCRERTRLLVHHQEIPGDVFNKDGLQQPGKWQMKTCWSISWSSTDTLFVHVVLPYLAQILHMCLWVGLQLLCNPKSRDNWGL